MNRRGAWNASWRERSDYTSQFWNYINKSVHETYVGYICAPDLFYTNSKQPNENDFSQTEISVSTESADSFVIAFTPETKGQREFLMLITNGHIKDTLNYEVFVSEKIPVWNLTEK